jgi:hypothetical protein
MASIDLVQKRLEMMSGVPHRSLRIVTSKKEKAFFLLC